MTARKTKNNTSKFSLIIKVIAAFFIIMVIIGGIYGYKMYKVIYQPNISLGYKEKTYLYIKTGSNFNDVKKQLYDKGYIINQTSFEWLAERKNYIKNVKPGKYLLKTNMSNNELINMLRSGDQELVQLTFNSARTKEQLVSKICKQLETDSAKLLNLLNDKKYLKQFNASPSNILVLFIPDTYEIKWNTSAEQLMERIYKEYKAFWNNERKEQAKKIGLSPAEVSILASIVQQETNKVDEMGLVAGVYINRLRKGMLLQADPTVVYALGDFTIRRLLYKHLEIDSPYNTYKYSGLPPGPISLPSQTAINQVLEYKPHDYIFFCAKEDFSGYHNFAKTGAQHGENARRYQKALNNRNIKK